MTSSATVPPSATCFNDNLFNKQLSTNPNKLQVNRRLTYCIYLETNLFMIAPVIAIHGKMEVRAKARRQLRSYATMKPVAKADKNWITIATFSDDPCCTKSENEGGGKKVNKLDNIYQFPSTTHEIGRAHV